MTTRLFLAVFFLLTPIISFCGEIIISGTYKGEDLYVQNPFLEDNITYCVSEVVINEEKAPVNTNSSAFMIDLSSLKNGQAVTVRIIHSDGCKPRVINPDAIRSTSAFRFTAFDINTNALVWKAEEDTPGSSYFVESFVNNNWVVQDEVKVRFAPNERNRSYSYPIEHHSGVNKYRVKYLDRDGKVFYTTDKTYSSDVSEVTFYPKRASTELNFSAEVSYQILNTYGDVVKEGHGVKADISKLPGSKVYYLNYDNKTEKFFKK